MTRDTGAHSVLVTGGAGFIGSHLVARLVDRGWSVLVIDDLSSGSADNLPGPVRVERLDIAVDPLDRVVASFRPDLVVHLAAQASVPLSIADPARDEAVNVAGTERLLAAIRIAGPPRIVFTSSGGAVYGERRRPATERSRPAPASPYAVHKLLAEARVSGSGGAYAIARLSNVYGPRQAPGLEGAVVAAFLDQAQRTGTLVIHGDGLQTRDFVHVRDVIAALELLTDPATPNGIWNVARGRSITVLELGQAVEAALGRPLGRTTVPARTGDVRHSALIASRLNRLGWTPEVDLATGLDELVLLAPAGPPPGPDRP